MPKVISDTQILEAALDVITQEGYAGATTRQIAAAAGINEVTLFRRFGNKQRLLLAVVEQELENFVTAGISYTGDVESDLTRVVRFYHTLMQTRGRVITMLLNEVPRQPELLKIMDGPRSIITEVSAMLKRYQTEEILIEESPLQAFMALVGPLFLAGTLGTMDPTLAATPIDVSVLVRRYLQGRRCGRAV